MKAFDSTMKQLLADFAADWVAWMAPGLGMPADTRVVPFDPELSTVQLAADKVFQLEPPARGLLHLEFQTSWGGKLPARLHTYNTILHDRYEDQPVYSVAVLLRKDAEATAMTGAFLRHYPDGREYLRFQYSVLRVWELSIEELLHGGIGAIPLALLTDEAEGRLRETVKRVDERLQEEAADEPTRRMLLTSSFILCGMRYNQTVLAHAFSGVTAMEESSAYQLIMERGEAKGLQQGRQQDLLDILEERFGVVPEALKTEINACRDNTRLQRAIRTAVRVATLDEFQL